MPNTSQHEPRFYYSLRHNDWVLDSNITYTTSNGIDIAIRKGLVTNLASVPFFVKPIIDSAGRYNLAAVVHDYLYGINGVLPNGKVLTRKQCDDIFYEIMVNDGVSKLLATTMWASVRYWPLNYNRFKQ